MRKDDEDYEWESDAILTYSGAAESEFKRLKDGLKAKAGILPTTPWRRAWNRVAGFLGRLMRFP